MTLYFWRAVGRRILFAQGNDPGNEVNIWRMGTDGSEPKQLTDGEIEDYPTCSPDSKWEYYNDLKAIQPCSTVITSGLPPDTWLRAGEPHARQEFLELRVRSDSVPLVIQ